jgi:hypothetical protein
VANQKVETIEKLETPKSLKILCIMSFLGFAAAMVIDTVNYLSYSSIEDVMKTSQGFEDMSEKLQLFSKNDIEVFEANGKDISTATTMRIALLFMIRAFIDVIALLGVSMMFIRLKLGFVIYAIFQVSYAAIPFVMFGAAGGLIVGYDNIAITLVYVALFLTQKRHLIR